MQVNHTEQSATHTQHRTATPDADRGERGNDLTDSPDADKGERGNNLTDEAAVGERTDLEKSNGGLEGILAASARDGS